MIDHDTVRRRFVVAVVFFVVVGGACAFVRMPGTSHQGALPAASDDDVSVAVALGKDVEALAGTIGERNYLHKDALERAAVYVSGRFNDAGYDDVVVHEFVVDDSLTKGVYRNLVVEVGGGARKDEIVLVGAHYDTAPGTPGANDNASGVAVLLSLAASFHGTKPVRTLRFVAFANEEPPFFDTPDMGSRRYAASLKTRREHVVAMLSLETIGCYSDVAGSQHYPPVFGLLYPDTGNFIAFVSDMSSAPLTRAAVGSFRSHVAFPSEGVAAPGMIEGIYWSDHASFWPLGVPAVMVTDTALFRYPNYHQGDDTPEKVDVNRLARVTQGLRGVVDDLARGGVP